MMRFSFANMSGKICLLLTASSLASLWLCAEHVRWLPPFLVGLAYLSFCLFIRDHHRSQQTPLAGINTTDNSNDMTPDTILVAYATQTGYAEQLAIKTAEHLRQGNAIVQVRNVAQIDMALLKQVQRALFIVSTTGEGDPPDQASGFTRKVLAHQAPLAHLGYAVLALGDRHYQHYCAFGHQLQHWLRHQQAHSLFDMIEVDKGDEGALRHWQYHLGVMTGHTGLSDWNTPGYDQWQLTERRLLNPDSLGDPVYQLAFTPDNPQTHWQAGDIAEIGPEYPPEETVTDDQTDKPLLPHREYSISSIPADGKLELLVRQMRYPDGRLGIGSGWLTAYAAVGQTIALRIRENRPFHTPTHDCPLILIGNGTGLAGLRAHLKTRAVYGFQRNCLFFGERQQDNDFFHREDIAAWQRDGLLPHLHLCFSRDQQERRYVQHALQEQAALITQWAHDDAVILVCGSLQGMAEDVHQTLITLLGAEQLEHMAENGRYRRDVY